MCEWRNTQQGFSEGARSSSGQVLGARCTFGELTPSAEEHDSNVTGLSCLWMGESKTWTATW